MKLLFAAIVFVSVALGVCGQDDAFAPKDLWVDNCGLNACAFVARWFDRFVDPYGMQGELEIGDHCERPASLLAVKRSLEGRGLKVSAYKEARLEELLAEVDGKHVCLFHINVEDSAAGHFYVLVAATRSHVLLVDAAKRFAWVPVDKFKAEFGDSFSGFYLSVSRPSLAAGNASALHSERSTTAGK